MGETVTTVPTPEWTQMIKKLAYHEKALELLIKYYHRAIEENQTTMPIGEITDVLEIAEAEKEIQIIGGET